MCVNPPNFSPFRATMSQITARFNITLFVCFYFALTNVTI